jgi:hypothetical protein
MPSRREQFRIRGRMEVIRENNKTADAKMRPRLWRSLSDATRATFFWPAPGTTLVTDPAAFPTAIGVDEPVPATFEVLALDRPMQVEYLNLNPHPHDRRRWREENGWQEERLNP